MTTIERVAVVTGGNKGIGYALVKYLAKKFDGIVYLTARNESLGEKAVKDLEEKEGLKAMFHQLDVTDLESIKRFSSHIRSTHGGIDILINNAGVLCDSSKSLKQQIEEVVNINYFGVYNVSHYLFPLLRPHARVVNVSSDWGVIYYVRDDHFKQKLMNKNNTIEDVNSIMREYLQKLKSPDYSARMYEGYQMSKNGVNALTRAQQHQLDQDEISRDILVAAVHPGEVITDMNPGGNITADESIKTIVYLVMQPPNSFVPRGAYWYEMNNYEWDNPRFNLSVFH